MGTVTIAAGATLIVTGAVDIGFYGSLVGDGTLQSAAAIAHAGIMSAQGDDYTAGSLNIDGDVTFEQFGELWVDIFALANNDLVTMNDVDLSDTGDILRLVFAEGFAPLDGQTFTVLNYDSVTTASGIGFNSIYSNLASTYTFTVAYGATAATVTVHHTNTAPEAALGQALDTEAMNFALGLYGEGEENEVLFEDFSTNSFTVEAWVNLDHDEDAMHDQVIATAGNHPGTSLTGWSWVIEDGDLIVTLADGTTAVNLTSDISALEGWHHIAMVVDRTNAPHQLRAYLDGTAVGTPVSIASLGSTIVTGDTSLGGSLAAEGADNFHGLIDEVRIWDYARSATQISDNRESIVRYNESGLIHYWAFDGNLVDERGDLTIQSEQAEFSASTNPALFDVQFNPNDERMFALGGVDADHDSVTATVTDLPDHGTLYQVVNGQRGAAITTPNTAVSDSSGRVIYVPGFYAVGADTFTYSVSDGNGGSDTQTVSFDIIAASAGTSDDDILVGTAGADTLIAGAGFDLIYGGAGDDIIDGGTDIDIIDYRDGTGPVTVNLSVNTQQAIGGGHGNDTLSNIEGLWGGAYNDVLTGNSALNQIDGGAGDDQITGNDGDDILSGGGGGDTILGGGDADELDGGEGDDIIEGGTGGDTIIGGLGYDVFRYAPGDSTVANTDSINGFVSLTDKIEFIGMSGISYNPAPYTYAGTPTSTRAAINADNAISEALVFFNDGNHGYLYVKSAGAFGGTNIKLAGVTTQPQLADFIGIPVIHNVSGAQNVNVTNTGVVDQIIGTSGVDSITINGPLDAGDIIDLGASTDSVLLNYGGGNTVTVTNVESFQAGSGADHITVSGSEFSATTYFDGGGGADELIITTTGTLTKTAADLANINSFETWTLGSDQAYSLTLSDNNVVVTGYTLTIDGADVTANLVLNAGAETNGTVHLIGGSGNDTLTGGSYSPAAGGSYEGSGNGSDRIDVTGLTLSGATAFTIEAWVRYDTLPTNYNIVAEINHAFPIRLAINSGGQIEVYGAVQGGSVPSGTWTHIALTYGGGTATIYMNGQYVNSASWNPAFSATNLGIGGPYGGGTNVDGLVDDVRIWTVARSAGEIAANYTHELTGSESGLLAYYPLNGNANDITGNGHNGTLAGSGSFSSSGAFATMVTSGGDTLEGGDGNDALFGGAGADTLDGGDGFDRTSYSGWTSSVTVNLATGTATVGSTTDTLIGIESVTGTAYADTMTGSDNSAIYEYVDGIDHPVRSQLERFAGLAGADTINGGAGYDQVDYSQDAAAGGGAAVTVNLSTGTATDGFGNTDTLTNIEFVRGTAFNDTFTGSNNAAGTVESFVGLAGDDTFDGGTITNGATNRVDYSQDASFSGTFGVVVNIDTANHSFSGGGTIVAGTAKDGFGDSDSLTNINDVTATNNDDELFGGTTGFQNFAGLGGEDTISGFGTGITQVDYSRDAANGGMAGVIVNLDTVAHEGVAAGNALDGFGDTDTLSGIRGARGTQLHDHLFGGAANERFLGLGGDDDIDGGTGTDEVDYSSDASFNGLSGVSVNLATGTATDGFGDTDTLTSIENVTGSSFADTITGDSNANSLAGGAGIDTLTGGGGADTFVSASGGGLDTITDFSASTDFLNLSASANSFTYSESLNALIISSTGQGFAFAAGTGLDDVNFNLTNVNSAGGKIMSVIDNSGGLTGSTSGDTLLLTGTTSGKTASGGDGNDRIRDSSGNANTLDGGAGSDVLIGLGGSDTINLGSDSVSDTVVYGSTTEGGAAGDSINDFGSTDIISFSDNGSANFLTLLDRGTTPDGTLTSEKIAVTAAFTANYTTSSIFVFDAAFATSNASNLGDAAAVISGAMTSSSGNAAGRTSIFVVASGASLTGVYTHVDANGDGIVTDDELSILAIVNGVVLTTSNFGGTTNNQTITGTSGNDTLTGGIDNDLFTITAGSDVYYTGGGGTDRLNFGTSYNIQGAELIGNDLVFTYTAANTEEPFYTATIASHTNGAYTLEQATFEFRDEIRTLDVATTFSGAGFTNDTAFAGTSAANTITAGAGDDILLGNGGADTLLGNGGDDWLVGGQGNDTINGGSNGTEGDTISFVSSPSGVIVDLSSGFVAEDGWDTSDTISEIENVEGSDHDDDITGNSTANSLEGGGGADDLFGGAGNDRFIYRSESDSGMTETTRDMIWDFDAGTNGTHNDQIDISALIQGTFSFVGDDPFTVQTGNTQARYNESNPASKMIEIDTDGDATIDMQIQLNNNFDGTNLDTDDFKHTNSSV